MSLLLCLTSDFTYFWIPECSKIQEGERSIILQGESSVTFEAKVGRSGGVGKVCRSADQKMSRSERAVCGNERRKSSQEDRQESAGQMGGVRRAYAGNKIEKNGRIRRSDGGVERRAGKRMRGLEG